MFKWLNKIRLKGLPTKTDTNILVVDDNGDRWFTDEYGDKGGGMNYMWDYL